MSHDRETYANNHSGLDVIETGIAARWEALSKTITPYDNETHADNRDNLHRTERKVAAAWESLVPHSPKKRATPTQVNTEELQVFAQHIDPLGHILPEKKQETTSWEVLAR